jgi:hypothetical protein
MTNIRMRKTNGVFDAMRVDEREYREIPGLEGILLEGRLGVSRGGVFKELDADNSYVTSLTFDAWPHAFYSTEKGIVRADVRIAVALTWLTAEDRDEIRQILPPGTRHDNWKIVDPLVERYNVSKHAITRCSSAFDNQMKVLWPLRELFRNGGEEIEVKDARVESYAVSLSEYVSPPATGSKPDALHLHSLQIDGENYTFHARGRERMIASDETVDFRYVLTSEGRRMVLNHTISALDATRNQRFPADRRQRPGLSPAQGMSF